MTISAKVPYIEGKVLSLEGDINPSLDLHYSVLEKYRAKIGEFVSVPFEKCYFKVGIHDQINIREIDDCYNHLPIHY